MVPKVVPQQSFTEVKILTSMEEMIKGKVQTVNIPADFLITKENVTEKSQNGVPSEGGHYNTQQCCEEMERFRGEMLNATMLPCSRSG